MKKTLFILSLLSCVPAIASEPLSTQDISTLQKRLGSIDFELVGKSAEVVGRKVTEEPQASECKLTLARSKSTGRILLTLKTEGLNGQVFEFNDEKTHDKNPSPAKITSENPTLITIKESTVMDTHDDQTGADTGSNTLHSEAFIAFDKEGKVGAAQFNVGMLITCIFNP